MKLYARNLLVLLGLACTVALGTMIFGKVTGSKTLQDRTSQIEQVLDGAK